MPFTPGCDRSRRQGAHGKGGRCQQIVVGRSPISADSVALIDWPANMPLTGAFTKPEDVIGRSVIYPIDEHQPILDHDVLWRAQESG